MPTNIDAKNFSPQLFKGLSPPLISTHPDLRDGSRTGATPEGTYNLANMTYLGAFRINYSDAVGQSDFNQGRIGFNPPNGSNGAFGSLFLDSLVQGSGDHTTPKIAEFQIPDPLSQATIADDLPNATNLQGYVDLFTKGGVIANGNDRVGFMAVVSGKLYVATFKLYDADGDPGNEKLIIFDNPNNLAGSAVQGWLDIQGKDRAVSWLSPMPATYQTEFGETHLIGNSGGFSINTRYSEGPSLFTCSPANIGPSDIILPATEQMGWDSTTTMATDIFVRPAETDKFDWTSGGKSGTGLTNNIYADWDWHNEALAKYYLDQLGQTYMTWYNSATPENRVDWLTLTPPSLSIVNNLWSSICEGWYGFIVPGTKTYLVIGNISGRRYGGAYKPLQFDGRQAGGQSPFNRADQDQWYWAFNMDDIIAATTTNPSPVQPYDRGVFIGNKWMNQNFNGSRGEIQGAAYDPATDRLYVSHHEVRLGSFSVTTVVSVWDMNTTA